MTQKRGKGRGGRRKTGQIARSYTVALLITSFELRLLDQRGTKEGGRVRPTERGSRSGIGTYEGWNPTRRAGEDITYCLLLISRAMGTHVGAHVLCILPERLYVGPLRRGDALRDL